MFDISIPYFAVPGARDTFDSGPGVSIHDTRGTAPIRPEFSSSNG